jgi:DnaJ-class molecular chaperone
LFKIEEINHPLYVRNGHHLIYTANITLADAIACSPVVIRTLDDRIVRVGLDDIPR